MHHKLRPFIVKILVLVLFFSFSAGVGPVFAVPPSFPDAQASADALYSRLGISPADLGHLSNDQRGKFIEILDSLVADYADPNGPRQKPTYSLITEIYFNPAMADAFPQQWERWVLQIFEAASIWVRAKILKQVHVRSRHSQWQYMLQVFFVGHNSIEGRAQKPLGIMPQPLGYMRDMLDGIMMDPRTAWAIEACLRISAFFQETALDTVVAKILLQNQDAAHQAHWSQWIDVLVSRGNLDPVLLELFAESHAVQTHARYRIWEQALAINNVRERRLFLERHPSDADLINPELYGVDLAPEATTHAEAESFAAYLASAVTFMASPLQTIYETAQKVVPGVKFWFYGTTAFHYANYTARHLITGSAAENDSVDPRFLGRTYPFNAFAGGWHFLAGNLGFIHVLSNLSPEDCAELQIEIRAYMKNDLWHFRSISTLTPDEIMELQRRDPTLLAGWTRSRERNCHDALLGESPQANIVLELE